MNGNLTSGQVEALPIVHVVAGVLVKAGKVLIARRASHKALAGKWEFPGGKVEAGEMPEASLARELNEEFGIDVEVGAFIAAQEHTYPTIRIQLAAYWAEHRNGTFQLGDHDAIAWVTTRELSQHQLAEADLFLVPLLSNLIPS